MYEQINGQMVTWIKGVCTKAVPLKWYFLMEHSIESIFLHRSFIMSLQHVPLSLHIVFWLANEFKFSMCWILFVPCLLHSYPGCSLIASLALPDIGVWVARRGAQGRGVFNCHIQGGRGGDKLPQLLTIPCQSQVDSKKLVRYPRHRLLKASAINLKFHSSPSPHFWQLKHGPSQGREPRGAPVILTFPFPTALVRPFPHSQSATPFLIRCDSSSSNWSNLGADFCRKSEENKVSRDSDRVSG